PNQLRSYRIRNVPGAQRPGATKADVEPVVWLIDDRMVRVLSVETWRTILLAGQNGPAQKFRVLGILEIPDVQHDRTEPRLSGGGIEQARLLGPVALVRPDDELAAAARPAVVRRRAGYLRHQRNLRGIGRSSRDVEDLELEVLARVPAAAEIVTFLGTEVVHHLHGAGIYVCDLIRDVPDELRFGRVGDLEDRRSVVFHLPGDGIENRLVIRFRVLVGLRVVAIVRTVADIHPV